MVTDLDIANFLAQNIPEGTAAYVHLHADGKEYFHINADEYRTFFETTLPHQLAEEMQATVQEIGAIQPPEDKALELMNEMRMSMLAAKRDDLQASIQFYDANKETILSRFNHVVKTHLSIPHDAPDFSGVQAPANGSRFTMVEPWDHRPTGVDAETYLDNLRNQHKWFTLASTLQHHGASVDIIPSSEIDGTRDVWARDPAIVLDRGNGQEAFVYGEQYKLKRENFDSYHDHLRTQGVRVHPVNAEIEGGNVLVDTKNGVILFSLNISGADKIDEMRERQIEVANKFRLVYEAIKEHDAPWYRDVAEAFGVQSQEDGFSGAFDRLAGADEAIYFERLGDLYGTIPDDLEVTIEGKKISAQHYIFRLNGELNVIMAEREGYYNALNEQADALQEATGMPVIPIPMLQKKYYHLDTFAGVLSDGTLMIHPSGTDAATMVRLQSFYGDKLLLLNNEDLQGLGSNFVEFDGMIVTHHLSEETRNTLKERGYDTITAASLGYEYGFKYDVNSEYIGSGIRCLTDEVYTIDVPSPNDHIAYDASLPSKIPASTPRL